MINVGDVGNDYEHCLQLMKKLNEFRGATSGVRSVYIAHSLCDGHSNYFFSTTVYPCRKYSSSTLKRLKDQRVGGWPERWWSQGPWRC